MFLLGCRSSSSGGGGGGLVVVVVVVIIHHGKCLVKKPNFGNVLWG